MTMMQSHTYAPPHRHDLDLVALRRLKTLMRLGFGALPVLFVVGFLLGHTS